MSSIKTTSLIAIAVLVLMLAWYISDSNNTAASNAIAAAVDHNSIFTQPFSQSNEADWFSQTSTTNDGTDALQSGTVQTGDSACFQTEVLGPAIVSFYWKVDSEQNVDFLSFRINGNRVGRISGEVDWQQQSHRINSREDAVLQWCYRKDSADDVDVAVAVGTAYIDQISINTPALTILPGLLRFSWPAVADNHHYRIQASNDGGANYQNLADAANLLTTTYEIPISTRLFNWGQRQYRIQSCNANESVCRTVSEEVLTLGDSVASIAYIKASNPGAGDQFGWSVALSDDGNTLAVGAILEGISSAGMGAGAAYVFTRSGTSWSQQAYIRASNRGAFDQFGGSVALSGDGNTLAVGAIGESGDDASAVDATNDNARGAGAVYVFTRTGASWAQQDYIKASNLEAEDLFGRSVALSADGNTLAVGTIDEAGSSTGINGADNNDAEDAGAVYVFTRTGASWTQQAYIKASNLEAGDEFGFSIALSDDGNTLAVGANNEGGSSDVCYSADSDDPVEAGAAYVFTRSGTSWTQQAYIKASNPGAFDGFGWSVALSGDGNTLAVGANFEGHSSADINGTDNNDAGNAGAVYVFTRAGTSWSQQAYIKATNADGGDVFGGSIALSDDGNTLAVGAILESGSSDGINGADNNDAVLAGAAYVFVRTGTNWTQQTYIKASNPEARDRFGSSIALSDDGNTLAVGAILEDGSSDGINGADNNGARNAGAVYLY